MIAALSHYYGVEVIVVVLLALVVASAVEAFVLPFLRRRRTGMPRSR